jgi:hypothetical protein
MLVANQLALNTNQSTNHSKGGTATRCFSPGPLVSSSNKTDRHDIAEILLKVTLSTIKETNKQNNKSFTDHTKIRIRELNLYTSL